MALREALEFEWNGEQYSYIVTMKDLAEIENTISLTKFSADVFNDNMKYTQAAVLGTFFMLKAGAKLEVDDFYMALVGSNDENTQSDAADIISRILICAFPQSKKKSEHQAQAKPKRKTRKKKAT